jgi:hypothetical protein
MVLVVDLLRMGELAGQPKLRVSPAQLELGGVHRRAKIWKITTLKITKHGPKGPGRTLEKGWGQIQTKGKKKRKENYEITKKYKRNTKDKLTTHSTIEYHKQWNKPSGYS